MPSHPDWGVTFVNDGGPLIAMPAELLPFWNGGDGPPHDGSEFGVDYERACDAAYPAAAIEVGPGVGVVIGSQDAVMTANWLRLPRADRIALVGWEYADDGAEEGVARLIDAPLAVWQSLRRRMVLASGELVLLHAACRGNELDEPGHDGRDVALIGDVVRTQLAPGEYDLEVLRLGGDLDRDPFGCVVIRWQRVAELR